MAVSSAWKFAISIRSKSRPTRPLQSVAINNTFLLTVLTDGAENHFNLLAESEIR
jgi:hypothetical protein